MPIQRPRAAEGEAEQPKDSIDRIIEQWCRTWPELPAGTLQITTRMARIRSHLDNELEPLVGQFGLTGPTFRVLGCLRRQGPPYQLLQTGLSAALGLTPGTVSVRVDALVEADFVRRESDPNDRRGALVSLTPRGLAVIEQALPAYLAAERRLLSGLTAQEQQQLGRLLRRLIISYDGPINPERHDLLGIVLTSPRLVRKMQRAVGLPERAGLLVKEVDPNGPAGRAGIEVGDLLVSADNRPLHSMGDLHSIVQMAEPYSRLRLHIFRAVDERDTEVQL